MAVKAVAIFSVEIRTKEPSAPMFQMTTWAGRALRWAVRPSRRILSSVGVLDRLWRVRRMSSNRRCCGGKWGRWNESGCRKSIFKNLLLICKEQHCNKEN